MIEFHRQSDSGVRPDDRRRFLASTRSMPFSRLDTHSVVTHRPGRFVLWVDGVGGYLVCERSAVVLGQPSCERDADIPILADISRRHAVIRRDGEGYVIEPLRPTSLNEKPVERSANLPEGAVIGLGRGVRLAFCRPNPLSRTARIDFRSPHRTQPLVDAVLLLSGTCVLGPGRECHVRCRDWSHNVILCRREQGLEVRAPGTFEIDGLTCSERGEISRASQIAGDDFSLSLEPLS